jgi:hypothetical protein
VKEAAPGRKLFACPCRFGRPFRFTPSVCLESSSSQESGVWSAMLRHRAASKKENEHRKKEEENVKEQEPRGKGVIEGIAFKKWFSLGKQ